MVIRTHEMLTCCIALGLDVNVCGIVWGALIVLRCATDDLSCASFSRSGDSIGLSSRSPETAVTVTNLEDESPVQCTLSLALPPQVLKKSSTPLSTRRDVLEVKPRKVGVCTLCTSPDGHFVVAGGEDHLACVVVVGVVWVWV